MDAGAAAVTSRLAAWAPSLPLALALFALFLALELLQRWAVLRPVRAWVGGTRTHHRCGGLTRACDA